MSEIVTIAINDLFVPDWNPRKLIKEAPLQDLTAFIKGGGIVPKLWVWKGAGIAPFAVISGQRRLLAYKRLGYTELEVEMYDVPLEQAKIMAISSNQDDEMHWWDRYKAFATAAKSYSGSQRSLAPTVGADPATINRSVRIFDALTPSAVAFLDEQFITENSDYDPSFRVVLALSDLKEPQTVEKALKVAINLKLTEPHAKSLVKWVKAGNPPETFSGHKAPKTPKPKPAPGIPPEAFDKLIGLGKQLGAAETRGEDVQPIQEQITAYRESLSVATQSPSATPHSVKITSPEGFTRFRQMIGDITQEVFKPSDPKPQTEGQAGVSIPIEKEIGTSAHWAKKLIHGFVKPVWHKFLKYQHRFCKKLAKVAVPEHYTHSGQTRSGHKGASRGLMKELTTFALTLLHWAVYGFIQLAFWWIVLTWLASRLVPFLKPGVEWPFRWMARQVLAIPAEAWAWGSSHIFPAILIAAVLLVLISMASKVEPMRMTLLGALVAAAFYYGPRWADPPNPIAQTTDVVSTPSASSPQDEKQALSVPISQKQEIGTVSQTSISKGLGQPKHAPQPVASVQVYQPAISFAPLASPAQTLYDPKLLEQEIAALPKNCIVKAFPVLPDEGMPGDLAVSRLQDLTDADKYTMKLGGGTEKIMSISPTTTNLIVNYKSADALGVFLDGSGQLNFFWEDVKYIHTDEVDVETKTPSVIYQCSLVVSGSKNPLTIQCASTEDLDHLVSTMQYFIRSSRLGRDTTLAGMPYPYQGLALNNDGVVEKLWAQSPMDKAGVVLGDHLWSVGKVISEKQSRNDLEKGLQSASTFYLATSAEWEKALLARDPAQANSFRPKLRKIALSPS